MLFHVRRFIAWLRRDRLDDELAEEIRQHLERRREAFIDQGLDPASADAAARRLFGNVVSIREEARDMWSFPSIESVGHDVRYGARTLRRSPSFAIVAVFSLIVGIGAASAVFALADAVLFRELPVPSPSRLIGFRWIGGPQMPLTSLSGNSYRTDNETSSTSFSLPTLRALAEQGSRYAEIFGFATADRVTLSIDRVNEVGSGMLVSGNYFGALRLAPAAGRPLGPADDAANAPAAAMISHAYWQRRFGGDVRALGRQININGAPFTIVGVMPAGFNGTGQVASTSDVAVPLSSRAAIARGDIHPEDPNFWWVLIMGRLRDRVEAGDARAPLDLILKNSVRAGRPSIEAADVPRLTLFPGARGQEEVRGRMREPLAIMLLVVSIVLLVACTNVSNLLLARGRARAREMAVRAVAGAPRSRLVRQLLTEAALLAAAGAMGGVVLARWLAAALVPAVLRSNRPVPIDLTLDWRFMAFTVIIAAASCLLASLVPAFRASNVQLTPALQETGRGTIGYRRRLSLPAMLVAAQVALCLLLVTTAGLLVTSLRNLERAPTGFDSSSLLLFRADRTLADYDAARARSFYAAALERIRALPGVKSATVVSHAPISRSGWTSYITIPGRTAVRPEQPDKADPSAPDVLWRQSVDADFFETFGIPIVRGRGFDRGRESGDAVSVVVSQRMAERFFPGEDAIGRRFSVGGPLGARTGGPEFEIVGVAGDAKYADLRSPFPSTAYHNYRYQNQNARSMTFAVKTAGDPLSLAPVIREALLQLDDEAVLTDVRTQEMQVQQSILMERLFARLAAVLGSVVVLLATVGLYGVVAYSVARRTGEIGIRMALGAERSSVRRMVLRESLALSAGGIVAGIPLALAGAGVVRGLLFGLEPHDPRTLALAIAVLVAVALAAAYPPARRASRVDPVVALRSE